MKKLATTTLAALALFLVAPACGDAEAGTAVTKTITDQFKSIGTAVESITSEATATEANTTITDLVGKIAAALPALELAGGDDWTEITDLIKTNKETLLGKLGGLDPKFKTLVQSATDKLEALVN